VRKGEGTWTGLIWLRIGKVEGACDCGNEPSVSIKFGEFLDWLGNCQILKEDCAAWSYLVLAECGCKYRTYLLPFPPTARRLLQELYRIRSHSLPGITKSFFARCQLPIQPECKATPFPVEALWGKKTQKIFYKLCELGTDAYCSAVLKLGSEERCPSDKIVEMYVYTCSVYSTFSRPPASPAYVDIWPPASGRL